MSTSELHEKYAPIMHFSAGEQFFPMSVKDFLSYAALYHKDQDKPFVPRGQVQPDHLTQRYAQEAFLRSVDRGSMHGSDVAKGWGKDTVSLIYKWTQSPVHAWSDEVARRVYDWFSEKTKTATRYFWWNKLLLPQGTTLFKRRDERSEKPRFRLPHDVRNSALENYQNSQGNQRNYTYYYRTVKQGSYLNLQYWFFYAYNDWSTSFDGFNDHEGDWEGCQLFFKLDADNRPLEPPAHICYLGHHSRISKPWRHPDIQKSGTHPHVYVAAGSHASYPEAKPYPIMSLYNLVDRATGDELSLSPNEWRSRINLAHAPWVHTYPGSWGTRYWLPLAWMQKIIGAIAPTLPGEISLPGVSAPRGPRFDDEGQERETWSNALSFAGIAET